VLVRDRPPRSLVAVRGRVIVPLAHCAMRACPFTWPADTGRRVCPDHDESTALATAATALGISLESVPGDYADGARGDRRAVG
jgi:hypothetical protein